MLINLVKIRTDRETREESFFPFNIYTKDILCLYKDRKGNFLVTKQGVMHKIKNDINDLTVYLDYDVL